MRKFRDWLLAMIFASIVARCMFYLGYKAYLSVGFEPFDWVAVPIGLVCAYISYMYFRRIFGRSHVAL